MNSSGQGPDGTLDGFDGAFEPRGFLLPVFSVGLGRALLSFAVSFVLTDGVLHVDPVAPLESSASKAGSIRALKLVPCWSFSLLFSLHILLVRFIWDGVTALDHARRRNPWQLKLDAVDADEAVARVI